MTDTEGDFPVGDAPGSPGLEPTWTSSAKDLIGTSMGRSRLWYTVGYGILNEVYYPRVDLPQIRDLGFIVADGKGFWSEVKRLKSYDLSLPKPGIPVPTVIHRHDRFTLTLRIAPDPVRDVLLIEVELDGDRGLAPYVLLAPHLGGSGHDNVAAASEHYGRKIMWAEQGPFGLALAAVDDGQRDVLGRRSAGYVGSSDGWQDFAKNGAMTWQHVRAGPGNVALLGELGVSSVAALGFGSTKEAAATLAVSALVQPFERIWQANVDAWGTWHDQCAEATEVRAASPALDAQLRTSRMVLRCHQDKTYPGAMVASLSVPWGNTRDARGGYHLVWPRDLVESAGALLGVGGIREAQDVLRYLIATQHSDGHWNQNQWLGGEPFWRAIQLDETAFPVLLAALLAERDALDGMLPGEMVRNALRFIARTGPMSDQDRWEEDRGINTFTLAVTIAALVAGAEFLRPEERRTALVLADDWNTRIESWTVSTHSLLRERFNVRGHYIRVAPSGVLLDEEAKHHLLPIKNRAQDPQLTAEEQIATDFLQLVRFGLRAADDPFVLDSIKTIDGLLRVETPVGPAWHRYNGDGYGEKDDGSEFDGGGKGRLWPLLTGERGHFELCAGRSARPFLEAMAAMTSRGGMLPEQVWDADPIPEKGLHPGRPTGSAMPLVWAHAEFIKLVLSEGLGRTYDCPASLSERYGGRKPAPTLSVWLEHAPVRHFFAGTDLLVCFHEETTLSWRSDDSADAREAATAAVQLGLHAARIPTADLTTGRSVRLNVRSRGPSTNAVDYRVTAAASSWPRRR